MLDGLNKTSGQQLLHLLYYLLFYFSVEHFSKLRLWLNLRVYIERMHHQPRVQPGHFAVVLCEYILEFFQQQY